MLLITGATGNIGRELTRLLDARGVEFRVLVRDPAKVTASERVRRVVGDWDRPDSLRPAFADVDGLFLLTPGIALEPVRRAVDLAAAAGVRRIVHVSSFNVLGDPMPAMGRWHHEREQLVRGSGIPATFLRPGGFMSNALEWAPLIRAGEPVLDPTGPGRYAPIDPADIAAVAALALTAAGHADAAHVLTGAETFTVAEQVDVLAAAIGRAIGVRTAATPAEALRSRYPNGAPQALAAALLDGLTTLRADLVGFRTDTVARLLGRPPATFADWCARHADAFRPAA